MEDKARPVCSAGSHSVDKHALIMLHVCVEVLGKRLISHCLCPPSSDGYPVEWESYIVMIGYSCSKVRKYWILPRGDKTVKECVPIPGV